MHFSRFQINPQRREAKRLLANPRAMHAAVESAFPPHDVRGDDGRVLWRVDVDRHDVRLYVVSPGQPDFRHLVEQAGWEASPGETTDYERFLGGLQIGQRYSFRVTVNPVKRTHIQGQRGQLLPLVGEQSQIEWLASRGDTWGFRAREHEVPAEIAVPEAPQSLAVRVVQRRDRVFAKTDQDRRRTVTQRQVTMTGELEVTDAAGLRAALVQGMGRGKAYGCGLMTLARDR